MLVQGAQSAMRKRMELWFTEHHVHPRTVGEFDDAALMKAFGQGTGAVFPAPAAIAGDVCRFYGVREIGRTSAVRERYYAISAERRLKHPGVLAITSAARDEVFAVAI